MSFDKRWLYALMVCLLLCAACPDTSLAAASPSDQTRSMYTIQVGAHQKNEAADRALERFKSFDLQVFKRHEAVKGKGMWYRIYVGLFATKALAMDFADDLKKRKIVSSYWVKTIEPPFPEFATGPAAPQKPKKPVMKEIEATPVEPAAAPRIQEPAASASVSVPPPPPKPQEGPPATVQPMEAPPDRDSETDAPTVQTTKPKTNFSIGLKAGGLWVNSGGQIEISNTGLGETRSYSFSGTYAPVGLVLSYQLTDRFMIRGGFEKAMGSNIDYSQFTLDAGVLFNSIGPLTPYASVGLLYGQLSWDEFIGDFDSGLGWKIGLGGLLPVGRVQIGAEVAYQAIDFNYTLPSGWSVSDGAESVDFSGFSISAMVMYRFLFCAT